MRDFFHRFLILVFIFLCVPARAGDPPPDGGVYGPTPAPQTTELPDIDDPANTGFITLHEVWKIATLGQTPTDPIWPKGPIAQDAEGNIYAAAPWGGEFGKGAIFKVGPDGEFSIVHAFTGEGFGPISPRGGVVMGPDNMLYGTTYGGGERTVGTIFKLNPKGGNPQVLWSFKNGWLPKHLRGKKYPDQEFLNSLPSYPQEPMVFFKNRLYGVTIYTYNQKHGMLYEVGRGKDGFTAIHYFNGEHEGRSPNTLAVCGGELYGTTYWGTGDMFYGTIFEGTGAKVIHKFNFKDGWGPVSLMCGKDGDLYGTTDMGGYPRNRGYGVIFKVDLPSRKFETLHIFDKANGIKPTGYLTESTQEPDFLYGTAYASVTRRDSGPNGIIYRIRKTGEDYAIVHKFSRYKDGHGPFGGLIQMTSSPAICGTTTEGGSKHNAGSVYCMQQCREIKEAKEPDPTRRICCAFGTNGVLGPDELQGYKYGVHEPGRGSDGFFYTASAGLMDLGHLRDLTDMTYFIYEALTNEVHCLNLYEGFAQVKNIPENHEERLAIAGSIAYVESLAHELSSWKTGQHFSSFSPEDMTSNMVGIEAAKRAIKNIGFQLNKEAFNAAVDKQFDHTNSKDPKLLINELNPISELNAGLVMQLLNGPDRWFSGMTLGSLNYRNFSGLPWMAGTKWDKQKVWPYIHPSTYEAQFPKFDYIMHAEIIGVNGRVTENQMNSVIKELKKQYESEGGKTEWKGIPAMEL